MAIVKREPIFSISISQEIVQQLKLDYPTETNRKIAKRLIHKKSILATLAGLIPDIPIVPDLVAVSLFDTSDLMEEMINQIAYSYGYDTIYDGEKVAFSTISFNPQVLDNFDLEFLMEQGAKVPTWGIKAGVNLALLLLVGYTTCEYYEYKQNKEKTILEDQKALEELNTKVITYSQELAAKEATLEAQVIEAVEIKKEVELVS